MGVNFNEYIPKSSLMKTCICKNWPKITAIWFHIKCFPLPSIKNEEGIAIKETR